MNMSPGPPAAPRRIATAHNAEGKSVQHDDLVEPEVLVCDSGWAPSRV